MNKRKKILTRLPKNLREEIKNYLKMCNKIIQNKRRSARKVLQLKEKGFGRRRIARKLGMREFKVRNILRGQKRIRFPSLPKKLLKELYHKQKLSTHEIGILLERSHFVIISWMKKYGLKRRGFREAALLSKLKFKKKVFNGTKLEKAYMIGFTYDCHICKMYKRIRITTGTTHPAQLSLFREVFGVWTKAINQRPAYFKKSGYGWLIHADLHESFNFLLKKINSLRNLKRNEFMSLLAGFIDAEGSIIAMKHSGRKCIELRISIGNLDQGIINLIANHLRKFSYHPTGPHWKFIFTDDRRKKKFWEIGLNRKREVIKLLEELPLKHKEKVRKKSIILKNKNAKKWSEIEKEWEKLRKEIEKEVFRCQLSAKREYLKRRPSLLSG